MSDDANNTSRPRVRYEQSPNGEVVRVTEIFRQQLPGSNDELVAYPKKLIEEICAPRP